MIATHLARAAFAALLCLPPAAAVSSAAESQGSATARLAQFQFDGSATFGGQIEVEVGRGEARDGVLLHLAHGTRAEDVALLVATRLAAAGHTVVGPAAGGAAVFVEGVDSIAARGTAGLSIGIAASDGPIHAVRLAAPAAHASKARVSVALSTLSPHDRSRATHLIEVELEPEGGAPAAASRLHDAATERKWASDRPGNDGWRPIRDGDARLVSGVSVRFESGLDWRAELAFTP